MRKSRIILVGIFIIVIAFFLFFLNKKDSSTGALEGISENKTIDEAFALITKHAVYPVSDEKLVEGAIRGMTDTIGDPYSTYFSEEEARAHEQSLSDERVGIGAEITQSQGRFIIVSPIKSSPAEKAGIKPYDEIVQVNGERVDGKSLKELLQLIGGEKGTEVTLTLYRPEEQRHVKISIMRSTIPVKTVTSETFDVEGQTIGYVTISMFGEKTAEEWEQHTSDLLKRGVEGIIIDVRSNPGGYLHSVEKVAGSMLKPGATYTFMQDSRGILEPLTVKQPEETAYTKKMKKIPVAILQNEGSASASEVLSGALKDLKRAFIIGTTSFGKGTVQETMELSNGGEVKLSTHKWLTPNQQWIHGKGIKADLEVEQNVLFKLSAKPVGGQYATGDYSDDIAYAQNALNSMGYDVTRTDGYFDEVTAKAVEDFRQDKGLSLEPQMDHYFFVKLREVIQSYKERKENDDQLQMAIGYMSHTIKSGK
ncbi:S41 family peptidase [Chungangia koreensis]|uniref:S41 family peptidase n=1 Tax=Chungangia koreensis TaxID=752657 RepID=A0ABV8X2B9_9LACT